MGCGMVGILSLVTRAFLLLSLEGNGHQNISSSVPSAVSVTGSDCEYDVTLKERSTDKKLIV